MLVYSSKVEDGSSLLFKKESVHRKLLQLRADHWDFFAATSDLRKGARQFIEYGADPDSIAQVYLDDVAIKSCVGAICRRISTLITRTDGEFVY